MCEFVMTQSVELFHSAPLNAAEKSEDEEGTEETLSSRLSRHGRKTDPIVELLNRVRVQ